MIGPKKDVGWMRNPVEIRERSDVSRENNFNLLRLLAASFVIISHGIELPSGLQSRDWANALTGHAFSWYAVNAFFVISGFLIFGSWDAKPAIVRFVWARFLRIVPGLFIMLVTTIFLLGIGFSSLPFSEFISSTQTLRYFAGCLSLVRMEFFLPGVFEHNPLHVVNGSLWTLTFEVVCYVSVAVAGVTGLLRGRIRVWSLVLVVAVTAVAIVGLDALVPRRAGKLDLLYQLVRLSLSFALGGLFFVLGRKVPIRLSALLALVAVAGLSVNSALFVPVASVATAYTVLWIAFVPNSSILLGLRAAPDYSYGLYIYAFPVQQALIALDPSIHAAAAIVLGFALTLVFAAVSWHFIERPALRLKARSPYEIGGRLFHAPSERTKASVD